MHTRTIALVAAVAASVLAISQLVTLGLVAGDLMRRDGTRAEAVADALKQPIQQAVAEHAGAGKGLSKADVQAAVKKGMIDFLQDRTGGGNQQAQRDQGRQRPASTTTNVPPVTDDDHVLGPSDAKYTMVTYMDYDCPYCARMHEQVLPKLRKRLGDRLRVVYRHRPLSMHGKSAVRAAVGAECVAAIEGEDAFWQLTDEMFAARGKAQVETIAERKGWAKQKISDCISSKKYASRVQKDNESARELGVQGTPTSFVMKSGSDKAHIVRGAQPAAKIHQKIEQLQG